MPGDELALFGGAVEELQSDLRSRIRRSMAEDPPDSLRRSDDSEPGDTAYGIDRVGESVLLELVERHLSAWLPVLVLAEGLPDAGLGPGVARVPTASPRDSVRFRVVVDPIDGTRGYR